MRSLGGRRSSKGLFVLFIKYQKKSILFLHCLEMRLICWSRSFAYSGFLLAVVSGLLIVAGLNSLFDKDADFS